MKDWYAVRGLFRWYFKSTDETDCIEKRIVLFKASSFDQALDLAELEARSYCERDPESNFQIEAVGHWRAYRVDEKPAVGVEIYSDRCSTNLSSKAFVRRYYPRSHARRPG